MMLPMADSISFPQDERIIISDSNADYCLGLLNNGESIFFCVLNTGHRAGTVPAYAKSTPVISNWNQVPLFIAEMAVKAAKELKAGTGAWERIRQLGYNITFNRL